MACLAWLLCAGGCYHTVEPIQPDRLRLEEGQPSFPVGIRISLENGYEAPLVRRLKTEGIHHLDTDLRDWSARMVAELTLELERRGVSVQVHPSSLEGTSVVLEGPAGSALRRVTGSGGRGAQDEGTRADPRPTLRVRVTEVKVPSQREDQGPLVLMELESGDGSLSARYEPSPQARTYRDALLELKRGVLLDPRFRSWISRQAGP